MKEILIEAQSGAAFIINKNQKFRIIDIEGQQVADMVAFNRHDYNEKLSTSATMDANGSIYVRKGDALFSNRYNELLEVVADSVGIHDILFPSCSSHMFRYQYQIESYHPSCHENLSGNLKKFNIPPEFLPDPFNIFMHTLIREDGSIEIEKPLSQKGDYIEFQARMNLIVAVSACSVRESKCNAYNCTPIMVRIM